MLARKSDSGVWAPLDTTPNMILDSTVATTVEGERRLMSAILAHALRSLLHDAQRPGRGAIRRLRQDLKWLTCGDVDDVFAFERICEALGLDASRIRRRVLSELGEVTELLARVPTRRRVRRAVSATAFEPTAVAS
jgi:hypothetical protein